MRGFIKFYTAFNTESRRWTIEDFRAGISRLAMAEGGSTGAGEQGEAAVHIVHVLREEDVDPEAHHVRTLASVLGRYLRASTIFLFQPQMIPSSCSVPEFCGFLS